MYDEGEYGDTLKSWVVPTYMLCAIHILLVLSSSVLYYIIHVLCSIEPLCSVEQVGINLCLRMLTILN